ncbi:hypothetical protein GN956_G10720 [Arapaima gigas]
MIVIFREWEVVRPRETVAVLDSELEAKSSPGFAAVRDMEPEPTCPPLPVSVPGPGRVKPKEAAADLGSLEVMKPRKAGAVPVFELESKRALVAAAVPQIELEANN